MSGGVLVDCLRRLIVAVLVITATLLLHGAGAAEASYDTAWRDYDEPAQLSQTVTAKPNQRLLPTAAFGDGLDRSAATLRLSVDFAAPRSAGDDVVELFRAPQPGQATGPLGPGDFPRRGADLYPNGRSHWTPDRDLADHWAKQYGTDVIGVQIPGSAYRQAEGVWALAPNAGSRPYLNPPSGVSPGATEVLIPRWMTPWLNRFSPGPS